MHFERRDLRRDLQVERAARRQRRLAVVRDGRLREGGVGNDDLDFVEGEHLRRAPVDLENLTDVLRFGVECNPIPQVEGALHLDREARHHVAEGLLERQGDSRRKERRSREDRTRLDARGSKRGQEDGGVDDTQRDVGDDLGQRAREAPAEHDVQDKNDPRAPDGRQKERERAERQDPRHRSLFGDEIQQDPKRAVKSEEEDGLTKNASRAPGQKKADQPDEADGHDRAEPRGRRNRKRHHPRLA